MTHQNADAQDPADSVLAIAASRGDDAAFAALYARYAPRIEGYLARLVGDRHLAEDVTHEVFVSALRRLRQDRPPIAFGPWLFRIARNAAIDRSRKTRPDMSIDELTNHPESGQNVEAEAARSIERDTLFNAMSKLKSDYREVLLLRFVEGYGAADVGRMTGRSEGAVRTLQHRALDRLRKELDRMGQLSLFERVSGEDAAE